MDYTKGAYRGDGSFYYTYKLSVLTRSGGDSDFIDSDCAFVHSSIAAL